MLIVRVTYSGDKWAGKRQAILCFIATDHEIPGRGNITGPGQDFFGKKINGFTCTVVWALDDKWQYFYWCSNIKGLDVLVEAESMVIFYEVFQILRINKCNLIDDYLQKGGPVSRI